MSIDNAPPEEIAPPKPDTVAYQSARACIELAIVKLDTDRERARRDAALLALDFVRRVYPESGLTFRKMIEPMRELGFPYQDEQSVAQAVYRASGKVDQNNHI